MVHLTALVEDRAAGDPGGVDAANGGGPAPELPAERQVPYEPPAGRRSGDIFSDGWASSRGFTELPDD